MAMISSIAPVVTDEDINGIVVAAKNHGGFTAERVAQIVIEDLPPKNIEAIDPVRMRDLRTGEVMENWTAGVAAHVELKGDTWLIFDTEDMLNVSESKREMSARVYMALTD